MNALPVVSIKAEGGGWIAACSCGHETYHPRRPGADRAAHEHRKSHARKEGS